MAKTAYVFPGQGSQSVGIGYDLFCSCPAAKAVFGQADETLGFPLSRLCFEGPEEELRQTINAQPALVTVSYACLQAIREEDESGRMPPPAFVAGHSLGEYTALAVAGVIDFPTVVYLARERGRLMHKAGQKTRGGMVAVLGLDEAALAEICETTDTRIANINCPGQLVISGAVANVAKASEMADARGAKRCIPLPVSGAFHSPLMQPAVEGMALVLADLVFHEPDVPIVANTTAKPLIRAEEIKAELLSQLCNSVQWQRSVERMIADGVSRFIEIGPGKVLTGLIKRINSDVETVNISDVPALKDLLDS